MLVTRVWFRSALAVLTCLISLGACTYEIATPPPPQPPVVGIIEKECRVSSGSNTAPSCPVFFHIPPGAVMDNREVLIRKVHGIEKQLPKFSEDRTPWGSEESARLGFKGLPAVHILPSDLEFREPLAWSGAVGRETSTSDEIAVLRAQPGDPTWTLISLGRPTIDRSPGEKSGSLRIPVEGPGLWTFILFEATSGVRVLPLPSAAPADAGTLDGSSGDVASDGKLF